MLVGVVKSRSNAKRKNNINIVVNSFVGLLLYSRLCLILQGRETKPYKATIEAYASMAPAYLVA
jgi:hypothetical protein